MRALLSVLLRILMVVAVPAYGADQPQASETVEEILGEPLPEEAYADPDRCLMLHQYDTVRVLNEQLVVFEGRRGRFWLSQLRNRCVGLKPGAVLKFNLRNPQVCELDTFRSIETGMEIGVMESGICMLGRFEPISEPQLDLLESALRMRRSSRAVDRTEAAEKKSMEGTAQDASKG